MEDIDDEELVLSVKGKINYVCEAVDSSYVKDGKHRTDRMRSALISDNTKTLELTVWADLIDLIKEDCVIQIAN